MTLPFVDLLESAVEQANDGIAVMRFTGNPIIPVRIVYANAAIERLSGFSRRELLEPSNPFLRVQPHNRSRYEEYFDRVRSGEPVLFDIELTGRDRATWCEIRWSPIQIRNEPVSHYVAVIRDISERRAEQRNKDLLYGIDHASYGLCIVEVPDGDIDARKLTYVNDALCSMFKMNGEDLLSRGLPSPVFPQSGAIFDEDLRSIGGVGSIERDLLLRRGDGSTRWFHVAASAIADENGTLERITLTYRDVDEEKRNSSNAHGLESSLGETPSPVFLVEQSGFGWSVRYGNVAFASSIGLASNDVRDLPLDTLLAAHNHASAIASIDRALRGKTPFTASFAVNDTPERAWNATPLSIHGGTAWILIARPE